MEMRTVAAGRGWEWIVEGFRIFRKQPLTWITLVIVMVVIWMVSTFVLPLIGPLAINLVSPVFFAGLMLACRTTDEDGEPEFAQLFAAFKTHASPLITVGGIYLVGNIVAVGIVFGVAGGTALPALLGKTGTDIETLRVAIRGLLLGMVVGMAVFIPILMAVWFAPLLVVFHNRPPVEAMKMSYTACLRNTLPLLVYGVATLVLFIIASIPLMLGLIVLLPVLVCSIYASYKDIFPVAPVQDTVSQSPNP
jgi:uncharacterized membrane protein